MTKSRYRHSLKTKPIPYARLQSRRPLIPAVRFRPTLIPAAVYPFPPGACFRRKRKHLRFLPHPRPIKTQAKKTAGARRFRADRLPIVLLTLREVKFLFYTRIFQVLANFSQFRKFCASRLNYGKATTLKKHVYNFFYLIL